MLTGTQIRPDDGFMRGTLTVPRIVMYDGTVVQHTDRMGFLIDEDIKRGIAVGIHTSPSDDDYHLIASQLIRNENQPNIIEWIHEYDPVMYSRTRIMWLPGSKIPPQLQEFGSLTFNKDSVEFQRLLGQGIFSMGYYSLQYLTDSEYRPLITVVTQQYGRSYIKRSALEHLSGYATGNTEGIEFYNRKEGSELITEFARMSVLIGHRIFDVNLYIATDLPYDGADVLIGRNDIVDGNIRIYRDKLISLDERSYHMDPEADMDQKIVSYIIGMQRTMSRFAERHGERSL